VNDHNSGPGENVSFTGVCAGPIVIRADSISLTGLGVAVIDGHGQDAVSIAGAHGVTLNNIEIRDGFGLTNVLPIGSLQILTKLRRESFNTV
jgi:hypothetical protein